MFHPVTSYSDGPISFPKANGHRSLPYIRVTGWVFVTKKRKVFCSSFLTAGRITAGRISRRTDQYDLNPPEIRSCFRLSALLFALALIVCLTPVSVFAQQPSSGSSSITVSATVVPDLSVQNITFETVYEINFDPDLIENEEMSVSPIDDPATAISGAGYILARGEPDQEFRITYSPQVVMTHTEVNSTLTVRFLLSHNDTDEQNASVRVLDMNQTYRLNERGEYHFWLGGTALIPDAVDGEYVGEFLLEMEYN